MKEVLIAENAGFCFGVKRAMNMAQKELEEKKDISVYALGPLIHNKQAVEKYENMGLITIDKIDDVNQNLESEMIIRSHGVPKITYDEAESKSIDIVDTTCPFVKKIHYIVSKGEEENKSIILLGDSNHPEVIGINGWCKDKAIIFKELEEVKDYDFDKTKEYLVVSQTTMNEKNFDNIIEYLETLGLKLSVKNTICSATRVRQQAARELSQKVDVMVVIGGKHSSNTQKLVKICSEIVDTISIETKEDMKDVDFSGYNKIGVTAGASTPDWIIEEAIEFLKTC
ncbi:4-hydroxy-3-methylbut-2-enyl diphosphate reductase [Peptostreptococcus russellii]|uniref:4-hydroxy-3-methylbut-2-enyl diphosphate reductase n=1 Tax=Peptostreptococcus russellii TaxID=215200 RepID=A0A1H8IJS6_9FIRM|nr:4-hydroxy-3-methylbut-2-enyl diphosphate reductase [Peptostreptococcus russellii]SEN68519.1 4-hydroxy-3-methylbut-2-enyl diphosphate reductase [Peptostreptococcus russellii]